MRKILLALFVLLLLSSTTLAAGQTLKIATWPFYYSQELIAEFEKQFDVKVEIIESDTADNVAALCDQVDLMIFERSMSLALINEGKLMKLDKSKLPNVTANVDPMLLGLEHDPNNQYTYPYHYVTLGLIYNASKIKPEEISLQTYFEPGAKFQGRITLFPSIQYQIGWALKYAGKSINSRKPEDLKLIEPLIANLAKYAAPGCTGMDRGTYDPLFDINSGKADLAIWYITPTDLSVLDVHENIGMKLIQEGSVFDMDVFMIPKSSKQVDLAHSFINFFYQPKIAALSINALYYPVAIKDMDKQLDPDLAKKVILPLDYRKKSEFAESKLSGDPTTEALWQKYFKN